MAMPDPWRAVPDDRTVSLNSHATTGAQQTESSDSTAQSRPGPIPVQPIDEPPRHTPALGEASSETRLQAGEVLCDRFRVVRLIARGGMGEVYEAEDLELGERIAIKLIRSDIAHNPRAIDRFRREIQLARRVTHPNVCRLFDVFRHRGLHDVTFLSMELLEGETLSSYILRKGRLTTAEALPIVAQLAAGLGAAHKAGVVHRDFKTGNVIRVGDENKPRFVITDFGLARDALQPFSVRQTEDAVGTPAYLAPEQVSGGEISAATDIYALGVVIFEMVTGRLPFEGGSNLQVALRRLTLPAPSPRLYCPELDAKWESTILRCLEVDPGERFDTSDAVLTALEARAASLRFGHYEVLSAEGQGTRGQLYRAWDSRSERVVVIQALPVHSPPSPQEWEGLKSELKNVFQISHNRICRLHDAGCQANRVFLVTEFVEGETLGKRLQQGPLALGDALDVAIEICEGLRELHRHDVIHGNLSPRAVLLTKKSGAKLMELGVSSLSSILTSMRPFHGAPESSSAHFSDVLFYCSPERLNNTPADPRSDVFALGAVLYEMLTGRKAFPGTAPAVVAEMIATSEPPLLASDERVIPNILKQYIKKCLAKSSDERFQTADDARTILLRIRRSLQARGLHKFAWWEKISKQVAGALAAIACILAVMLGISIARSSRLESQIFEIFRPEAARKIIAAVNPPQGTRFSVTGTDPGLVAVSPDGNSIAFVAGNEKGSTLWVRPMDSIVATALPGTEGASHPFWLPDSQRIGFLVGTQLKLVDIEGGSPVPISDIDLGSGVLGATANAAGTILFGTLGGPIMRTDLSGTTPQPVTMLGTQEEGNHVWPFFLPDGRHFLFLATSPNLGVRNQAGTVYVGDIESKEMKRLPIQSDSNVAFAAGHLLHLQNGILMSQPFDLKRMDVSGAAAPLAGVDGVAYNSRIWRAGFSATNGVLAYQTGLGENLSQLAWFDRSGRRVGSLSPEELDFGSPRLSGQGNKLVTDVFDPNTRTRDLWVFDVTSHQRSRFTFGQLRYEFPIWSPQENELVFSGINRENKRDLYAKRFGEPAERLLLDVDGQKIPTDWSRDGRYIALEIRPRGQRKARLHILSVEDKKLFPLDTGGSNTTSGVFSPDGKWIAYSSNRTGTDEVFIASFPDLSTFVQVSVAGGAAPRWSRSGQELFYVAPDGQMIVASLAIRPEGIDVSDRQTLFQTTMKSSPNYDVSPDGTQILINTVEQRSASPVVIVLNWSSDLPDKKR